MTKHCWDEDDSVKWDQEKVLDWKSNRIPRKMQFQNYITKTSYTHSTKNEIFH